MDRRIREVNEIGRDNVVVTQHKRFEVVPSHRYSGQTFRVLVGSERFRTRVMGDDEAAPPGGRVEQVPIEYEDDFQRDPEFALRQIVGIAVDSIAP